MSRCATCDSVAPRTASGECAECGASEAGLDRTAPAAAQDMRLAEIVEAFEAELRRGGDPDVDAWCRQHPSAGPHLRKALSVCRHLAGLASAEPARETPLPASLGPYRLLEEIGRGGMGCVVRARDERLGRDVAVKLLPADLFGQADHRQRFAREARALARIHHENVVPIHDVGEDGVHAYLVMELMRESVSDAMERRRLAGEPPHPVARRMRWILDAAAGLGQLHEAGIVHRDVKPGNLLLDELGRVRVGDLGLARLAGEPDLTRTGQAMGTAQYASPEQLRGEPATPRSDIFSLAATAYRLLTGKAPPIAPAFSDFPAEIPAGLRRAILEGLQADPDRRPPDIATFAASIEAALRPHARWKRRALVGAGLLVTLGAAGAMVATRGLAPRAPAAPLSDRTLIEPPPGVTPEQSLSMVLARGETFATAPGLAVLRARGVSIGDLLSSPAVPPPEHLDLAGRRFDVRVERDGPEIEVRLEQGDRTAARARFTSTVDIPASSWRFSDAVTDVDGDGLRDLLLVNDREIAFLRPDPQALRLPGFGWCLAMPRAFGEGSPILSPGMDAGESWVLVGDTGANLRNGIFDQALLSHADARAGVFLGSWKFPEPIHSTPRVVLTPQGLMDRVYVDTEPPAAVGAGKLFSVAAATPGDALAIAVPGMGRLTWPVFLDANADGHEDLIVGRRRASSVGFDGLVACLDPRAGHALLWQHRLPGHVESYPILSQQDGDPELEVCLASGRGFACLNAGAHEGGESRVAWSVTWDRPVTLGSMATEIADLTGDGLPEIASADQENRLRVFSRSAPRGILAEADLPAEALAGQVAPTGCVGRLIVTPDSTATEVRLLGITGAGFIIRWSLTARGLRTTSARFFARADAAPMATTASPVLVDLSAERGEGRWGVLVQSAVLAMLEPALDDPETLVPTWADWGVGEWSRGTPAVTREDGRLWIVTTAEGGLLRRTPFPASPPPIPSARQR